MMRGNLDHVYCNKASANVCSKDSSEQKLFKEVKQLQSILLLHLDLIQEQSDQILAKDKLIIKLKDENEMLKHQLEQVNKSMQQMKQQKEQRETSIPIRNVTVVTESLPRGNNSDASSDENHIKEEVITSDYDHFDTICDSFPCQLESDIKIENNEIEEEIFLNYSKSDDESIPSTDIPLVENKLPVEVRPPSSSTPINYGVDISQPLNEIVNNVESNNNNNNINNNDINDTDESNHFQTGEQDSNKDVIVINDDIAKISYNALCSSGNSSDGSLMKKACKTLFMVTKKPYITCNWKDEAITNDLERILANEAAELEIPCWTVIDDNSDSISSTCEPTSENISDEMYMKRHAKLELDERRRKKWDVQRIREQKNIERLKKRHLKTDAENEQKMFGSFYPAIDSIKCVQITEDIPVQAFGELIPVIPTGSFSLPWVTTSVDTSDNILPSEFGPGPLFCAATGVPSTTSTTATPHELKTKFLHRLAPNLNAQKQRFTKRVKKET